MNDDRYYCPECERPHHDGQGECPYEQEAISIYQNVAADVFGLRRRYDAVLASIKAALRRGR